MSSSDSHDDDNFDLPHSLNSPEHHSYTRWYHRYSKIRVTIFKNGLLQNGKAIFVEDDMDRFLQAATHMLGSDVPFKRIFNIDGGEIMSIDLILPNEVLFMSCGEDFIPPVPRFGKRNTIKTVRLDSQKKETKRKRKRSNASDAKKTIQVCEEPKSKVQKVDNASNGKVVNEKQQNKNDSTKKDEPKNSQQNNIIQQSSTPQKSDTSKKQKSDTIQPPVQNIPGQKILMPKQIPLPPLSSTQNIPPPLNQLFILPWLQNVGQEKTFNSQSNSGKQS